MFPSMVTDCFFVLTPGLRKVPLRDTGFNVDKMSTGRGYPAKIQRFFSFRLPRAFLRYSGCLGAFLTIPMDWDHPMRDPGRIRWVAPKARNLAIGVILLVTGHGGWRHFSPLRVFGARFSEGFGLRRMLAPSLGRPQLRFGREGFPQVQILENRSASAKPLRETPPPCDNLLLLSQWSTVC